MKIINRQQISEIIRNASKEELIRCIESAFIALSDGSATVPPVGHLGFDNPPGDMHIKYGYIKGDANYVIKVASGFYENQKMGLPNSNGLIMVFNANTGQPVCLLQDEGYLTDLRTALAGAIVAKHFGPKKIKSIGIIGTGLQARMQLELLSWITDCKDVCVWGRSEPKVKNYKREMESVGFRVRICQSTAELATSSNLIVTTTASREPLLFAEDVKPGTHITAMGSDIPGKQELEATILQKANWVACDSKTQCVDHGETHFAIKQGLLQESSVYEIGTLMKSGFERGENDITIADLTGIATQDIKIASFIFSAWQRANKA